MQLRYIGKFPPPYGGVTVKNAGLYEMLAQHMTILHREGNTPLSQLQNCLDAMGRNQALIVGISARGGKSKLITALLYAFNRKVMERSLYFMMGGTEASAIAANKKRLRKMSTYRCIYVETEGMQAELRKSGLQAVRLFPNCRKRPSKDFLARDHADGPLQCIFFGLIAPEKGADTVLEATKALPLISFDFYGHIVPSYEESFHAEVAALPNVRYHGVYRVSGENVYETLNGYDVLLLPTRCVTEGVPGALVEAKIAALPAIVSNVAYNADIVKDGEQGIVLEQNDVQALIRALTSLDTDREKLLRLKKGAQSSAERYYREAYLPDILSQLRGE